MKDLHKSKALQACRQLIDLYEKQKQRDGGIMRVTDLNTVYDTALVAMNIDAARRPC